MIKLYCKELSDKYIANYIYEYLRNKKIHIEYATEVSQEDDCFYILIGAQYLLDLPKYYGIVQQLPTSHLTKKMVLLVIGYLKNIFLF